MSEPNRPDRLPRPGPNGKPPTPPNGLSRFGRNAFAWVILISLAITLFIILQYHTRGNARSITYGEFDRAIQAAAASKTSVLKEVTLSGTELSGEFNDNSPLEDSKSGSSKTKVTQFYLDVPLPVLNQGYDFVRDIRRAQPDANFRAENHNDLLTAFLLQLIPWIIIIGAIYFFLFRQLKNSAGAGGMLGNFGRSKHRITSKEHTNVTFEDVAGVDEAKDEVREIVEFLKDAKRFQRLGGRIPRGVLLMGEPGTGKNAPGESHRRRSRRSVLLDQRVRLRRDVRRRRCEPGPRSFQASQRQQPLHHLPRRN